MRTISLRDGLRSDGIPASQRDLSTVRVSRALTTISCVGYRGGIVGG